MPLSAIITADIVNSTLLSPGERKKLIKRIETTFSDERIEFYRGDSFQVYCKYPQTAYTLILRARVVARGLSERTDIRSGMGIGVVKLPVRSLNKADSEAFVLSGRAFDGLENTEQRLKIETSQSEKNLPFNILANFTDFVFERMTSNQAEVIYYLLSGLSQQETARKLKKAQPTIAKHAKAGGWQELKRLGDYFENLVLL